ncbi:ATP-binding protein [Paraburkholderia caribensis]|uniref:ATP-binding protein n=1 Tax=Paraburkholderia caribensis TaxID=75105 RepID=UPI0034D26621
MDTQDPVGVAFTFGETTVRPARRELIRCGQCVEIGGRAYDLLLLLIEHRGKTVSKDRIMEALWGLRVVGDNALESQMSILRRILESDRSAIRTIAGKGYQFVGDLVENVALGHVTNAVIRTQTDRTRFPAQVSALIGREVELDELTILIPSRRLVTLVGAGGIGKTRLALETLRTVSERYEDGVFFAELAAIESSDHLSSAMASALGLPPCEGTKDLEKIVPRLQGKQFLLLIDNCEHLVDCVAYFIETLLRLVPGASVLATSRESLRITGEYVYGVPSLELPSSDDDENANTYGAIQLMRDRIGSDFPRSDERHAITTVVRICRQLDGIPLAIELAAACAVIYGLHGVSEGLNNRFELLRHGSRTALPRQQTLRATVDWSYELLPGKWQTVFNQLGVFAGTFTLATAQRMLETNQFSSEDIATGIAVLVNKSLVVAKPASQDMCYSLLDTIRAYAREKLEQSGTFRGWSERHARYMLQILSKSDMRPYDTTAGVELLYTLLPDLRSALAWSTSDDGEPHLAIELTIAVITPLMKAGLFDECLARVDTALQALSMMRDTALASEVANKWGMKLHAARGACLLFRDSGAHTNKAFASALKFAEANGDVDYQLRGLWGNWACAHLNGRHADSLTLASRIAVTASASDWLVDRIVAKRLTAISHLCLGNLDSARVQLDHISAEATRISPAERIRFLYDERMLVNAASSQALSVLGLHTDAIKNAEDSLGRASELSHVPSICYALSEAICPSALLAGDDSRLNDAVSELEHATRRYPVSTWRARAEMWRGLIDLRSGRVEAYASKILPALATIGNARYSVVLTPFLTETATALARIGRRDSADKMLQDAIECAINTGTVIAVPELRRASAEVVLLSSIKANADAIEAMLREVIIVSWQKGLVEWARRGERCLEQFFGPA